MSKETCTLEKAKELLIEKDWTQHTNARNSRGYFVMVDDPDACAFCLHGALLLADKQCDNSAYESSVGLVADILVKKGQRRSIVRFNDAPERTKDEVLQLLNEAIEVSRKEITKEQTDANGRDDQ